MRRRAAQAAASVLAVVGLAATSSVVGGPADAARTSSKPYTQPGPIHAGNTYGWYPVQWSHEWEYGEPVAPWVEHTDGIGRAANMFGMLTLDSGGDYRRGSHGSVAVTLGGPGMKHGRWEIRMRVPHWNGGRDYRVTAELVPTGTDGGTCSPHAVTFADFTGYGSTVDLSVRNGAKAWAHQQRGVVKNRDNWHVYAVEVKPTRVTWFVDSKPVASVPSRQAVSGKPLTVRLSLLAPDAGTTMNRTRMGVDWVRAWSLAKKGSGQAKIRKAPRAKAAPVAAC